MHRPGHKKQRYSNRPSIKDLSNDASRKERIKNLTLSGNAKSMQEFLNEEKSNPFYDRGGLGPHARENLWKQWGESNKPEIRQWSKEQFQKSGMVHKDPDKEAWWHNKPRAFHQTSRKWRNILFGEPIQRRMTVEKGSVEDFLAELPHSTQKASVWEQYKMPKLRKKYGEKVYDMPGNLEYEAHSIIQPKIEEEFYQERLKDVNLRDIEEKKRRKERQARYAEDEKRINEMRRKEEKKGILPSLRSLFYRE